MAEAFTDKTIKNLKPKDKPYRLVEARGFCVRVLPSGTKSFGYRFTLGGKKQELSLGVYPEVSLKTAREKYQAAYTKLQNGIDPRYVEPIPTLPENNTFKHFSDLFLAWSEQHHSPALYKINTYSLNNDVLPFWKDTPLLEIRRRDAIVLLERVALRSKGQVSNVQRAARGVFQHAVDRDYTEYNPLLGLTKVVPALKYKPRTRVLSDLELKAIWSVLPAHLKLILVTAQRPGEVAGMHSQEIQVGTGNPLCTTCRGCGLWTLPEERTKSGKVHLVYLTASALKLIAPTDTHIFPSPKPDRPVARLALSRYVLRAKYFNLPRWTPHDLRRTARTIMERIGILEVHSEAILAHGKKGMNKVYNQYEYQQEKAEALIRWEGELLRIVS